MNERIAETLKVLPDAPGVYIMHDAAAGLSMSARLSS